jgi:ABC-type dipeptide/oligopeptide/nickel transport system ATPase component
VQFGRNREPVYAVDGVSLTLRKGETLGLVGEAGAAKSVLIQSIIGVLPPSARIVGGDVLLEGESLLGQSTTAMQRILGRRIGLIVPNARSKLNPLLPVGQQLANILRAHERLSPQAAAARVIERLRMVHLPDPERQARAYPHELSGGMCQRILIAAALSHSPQVLLADEPTTGLDVTVQLQVLRLMAGLARDTGTATLLATRDLGIVAHFCQRVAVLRAGGIVELTDVASFFNGPKHPYSQALLAAARASVAGGHAHRATSAMLTESR